MHSQNQQLKANVEEMENEMLKSSDEVDRLTKDNAELAKSAEMLAKRLDEALAEAGKLTEKVEKYQLRIVSGNSKPKLSSCVQVTLNQTITDRTSAYEEQLAKCQLLQAELDKSTGEVDELRMENVQNVQQLEQTYKSRETELLDELSRVQTEKSEMEARGEQEAIAAKAEKEREVAGLKLEMVQQFLVAYKLRRSP